MSGPAARVPRSHEATRTDRTEIILLGAAAAVIAVFVSPPLLGVAGLAWLAWHVWAFRAWWLLGAAWAALLATSFVGPPAAVLKASALASVAVLGHHDVGAIMLASLGALPAWAPVSVPLGLAVAAWLAFVAERTERLAGAEDWSAWARTRVERAERRQHTSARAKLDRTRAHPGTVGRLIEDTDLHPDRWHVADRWLYPSEVTLSQPDGVIGGPGSGKTNYAFVKVAVAAAAGRRAGLIDCKGSDVEVAKGTIAAYLSARPDARVRIWGPGQPLDIWTASDGYQLAGRLLELEHFTEPYYRTLTKRILQLALTPPKIDLPRDVGDLLSRLNRAWLEAHWTGDEQRLREIRDLDARGLAGCEGRYRTTLEPLAARFNGTAAGAWRPEDADVFVIQVPTMADVEDAAAVVRLLLSTFRAYVGGRLDRTSPLTLLVDEFAQVGGGLNAALHLVEQGRGLGCATTLLGQSLEGIGEHRDASRLLAALSGGVTAFRSVSPDVLVALAGTRRQLRTSMTSTADGLSQTTAFEDGPAIDVNKPRQAAPGEAFIFDAGRIGHVQVPEARHVMDPGAYQLAAELLAGRAADVADADEHLSAYLWRAADADLMADPAELARGRRRAMVVGVDDRAELPAGPGRPELPAPSRRPPAVPLAAVVAVVRWLAGRIRRGVRRA